MTSIAQPKLSNTDRNRVVLEDGYRGWHDTPEEYAVLKVMFVNGIFNKMPTVKDRSVLLEAILTGKVVEEDGEHRLTEKGVKDFIEAYTRKVVNVESTENEIINFFKVNYSERLGGGKLDDPLFSCSNEGMVNFVNLLQQEECLVVSDVSSAYDYAVVDLHDMETGDTYRLFPGDAVVNTSEGYVIHNFRTE